MNKQTIKTILIALLCTWVIFPAFSLELYPRSTLRILSSAQKKLKKSDNARKNLQVIARKSTLASLKKELKQLIKSKKDGQAQILEDLISELQNASLGENLSNNGEISSRSKNIIQLMNTKFSQTDTHYQKAKTKINAALIVSIEKEMLMLSKRGKISAAMQVQSLLKTVKSPDFELLDIQLKKKKKTVQKTKPEKKVAKAEKEPDSKPAEKASDGTEESVAIRSQIDKNNLALLINLKIKAFRLKKKYPDNPKVLSLLADLNKMTAPPKKKYKKCSRCSGSGEINTTCKTCNGKPDTICAQCIGSGFTVKYESCSSCKGKGKTWLGTTCKTCNGKKRVKIKTKCTKCNGCGKIKCPKCNGRNIVRIKCPKCKGKGKISN